jgi:NitT/TauT family transport system ATP-binding protein
VRGIHLRGVSKQYPVKGGSMTALDTIDLTIREGEFVVLVGPSGCGKTSLLRILAGLEQPSAGTLDIDIESGDRPLRSMVFQGNGVFPWMKVIDNAAFGLTSRGVPKAESQARAQEFLERLGIGQFRDAWPRQLSGGMLQRWPAPSPTIPPSCSWTSRSAPSTNRRRSSPMPIFWASGKRRARP